MIRIFVRNWHLKLAAVLLATVLYTGLVFSGTFSESATQLPIAFTGQPDGTFVLSGPPGTVEVRYRAASDEVPALSSDDFRATVDLGNYDLDRASEPQVLPIEVTSLVDGVDILSREPQTVTVELDRVEEKTVPVEVEYGEVPEGLEISDPEVSVDSVQVRGAASLIGRVDRAVARVIIDESGIGFEDSVPLEPVDLEGQPVRNVELDPATVAVEIDVEELETNRTVPVNPQITGTPAPGFALAAIGVEPTTVVIRGLPAALEEITQVETEALNVDGASTDQTFDAELLLPEDIRLASAAAEPVVTVTATIVPSVSSRTFVLGVLCQGAGENLCAPRLDQVTVTLTGPAQVLAELTAADLTPTLDASGLGPGSYSLAPVIGGLPDGVDLLGVSPATIPVTVTAPATPPPTPAP